MKIPKPQKMANGGYRIQLRLGGVSVPVTAETEKECIRLATLAKAEFYAGKRNFESAKNITLEKACIDYIEFNAGRWSPSTKQGYIKIVNNQFPGLMKMPLPKIDSKVISKAVSEECARTNARGVKYSSVSVNKAYHFIAEVLKFNDVEFKTPNLPEVKRKPIQILTPQQVFEAVKGTEIELPCLLAMWMTFTISEIRGFTKSKSIRNGQLSVVETVVDINGKPVRKEGGKEQERTRTQNIPLYIQHLIDKVDDDIICPLTSQATNKRLGRLLEKAGLPHISFHKLRHISASVGALLNVPSAYIQERGGWKSDYTMRSVYTHTFTEERKAADEKIDNFFEQIVSLEN